MEFKDLLKRERQQRGWTQAELARRAKTTAVRVSRWERGEAEPSQTQLTNLAAAFEKSVSWLLAERAADAAPYWHSPADTAKILKGLQEVRNAQGHLMEALTTLTNEMELYFEKETEVNDLWCLAKVEREHVLRVLKETGGNKRRAASILGIDRSTLYRRLERYEQEVCRKRD